MGTMVWVEQNKIHGVNKKHFGSYINSFKLEHEEMGNVQNIEITDLVCSKNKCWIKIESLNV